MKTKLLPVLALTLLTTSVFADIPYQVDQVIAKYQHDIAVITATEQQQIAAAKTACISSLKEQMAIAAKNGDMNAVQAIMDKIKQIQNETISTTQNAAIQKITGTWKAVWPGGGIIRTFNADGTSLDSSGNSGTWLQDGNKVLHIDNGFMVDVLILQNNNLMTGYSSNHHIALTYTKQ